jgi:outer membrane protein assembly factor BamB
MSTAWRVRSLRVRPLVASGIGIGIVILMVVPGACLGVVSEVPVGLSSSTDWARHCGVTDRGSTEVGTGTFCARGVTLPYSGVVTVPSGANTSSFDWPELHRDPSLSGWLSNTTLSSQNAGNLGVAWATDLYGPALDSPVVNFNPNLNETLAYIGTDYGDVEAVNVANGQIVWGTWLGSAIRSTPLVSNGSLYVATFTTPALYRLNASSGAVECSHILPQTVEGTPTVGTPPGGVRTLYLPTQGTSVNGPFFALNAANCSVEWKFTAFNTPGSGSWDGASFGLNASGAGVVLFGSDNPDSSVYALNALTGQLLWRFQAYNPNGGDYDVAAGVLISPPGANGFAQGVAYTTNKIGRCYALDLNNGTLIWETNFNGLASVSGPARSTPALDGVNLVFGYHAGLFDLNALTGATIWDYKDPSGTESVAAPAIAGPNASAIVVTGDVSGSIDVVSLANGAQLYQYQTGGYISSSPAIAGPNIIIASSDGFLYDLAVGGGNGATLPTTSITAPGDAVTLPNPSGNQTVTGQASDPVGVAGVEVAVQSGGSTGPWWDAAHANWSSGPVDNPAILGAPGSSLTTWTFAFPVLTAGGAYAVTAYAISDAGQSDLQTTTNEFTELFSTAGANLQVSPSFGAPGQKVEVTGGGFLASERVAISLDGTTLASVKANHVGSITDPHVRLPNGAAFGRTSLLGTGLSSGRSATAGFDIANSWDQAGDGPGHAGYEANDSVLNYLISFNRVWVHVAWHFDPGTSFRSSPVVADGVAYVEDTTGHLYAVDIRNGGLIWTWTLASGASLNGAPAVDPAAGLVFVTASDGSLTAVSTGNGAAAWNVSVGGNLTGPTLADGRIYVASSTGTVESLLEATGVVVWSVDLGSSVGGSPAVDPSADRMVVGLASGAVEALNLSSGTSLWNFTTGGPVTAAVAVVAQTVFFGSTDHSVYALSESSGVKIWSYRTGGPVADTPAYSTHGTAGGGELLIGSNDGYFYEIQASNGSVNFKFDYSSPVVGVAAAQGVVVIETASGKVSGDRTFVGDEQWEDSLHGALCTAPTIVDGAVYVAAENGNLYAFTSYGQPPD